MYIIRATIGDEALAVSDVGHKVMSQSTVTIRRWAWFDDRMHLKHWPITPHQWARLNKNTFRMAVKILTIFFFSGAVGRELTAQGGCVFA